MTISAGTRLGPYEILAPIGAGGMGEVYKARDTRLDRTVAIKVLPDHLSTSEDVRQRFEREARTISQLSHPHICALYDVGREGETEYLVMELLEGETLANRLVHGPLPIEQTLRLGAQIVSALGAAHRKNIVHRDLKPSNVMATKSGVKLLDFGLAIKRPLDAARRGQTAAEQDPMARNSLTAIPTVIGSPNLTQEGTILGTLQYMAPEQLEGKEADARTDIFAFGAVLYEMATGRKAFSGASQASLISSIMSSEPPSLPTLQPMTPPALDRVVKTCLAKDPDDRWQTARDVELQLAAIAEGASVPRAGGVGARSAAGRLLPWAIAAVALMIAAAGLLRKGSPTAPAPRPIRFLVAPPANGSFTYTFGGDFHAVSPDGSQLAYIASESGGAPRIYVRPLASLEARPIVGTDGARSLFWSPDGASLAFFAQARLRRVEVSGGEPVTICEVTPAISFAGTWGQGEILFTTIFGEALYRVSPAGGAPAALMKPERGAGEAALAWPWFLPDGKRFLYLTRNQKRESKLMLAAPGKPPVFVMPVESHVQYAEPGYLVFAREGALLGQRFDPGSGKTVGEPFSIAGRVQYFLTTSGATFAVSRTGTLAFQPRDDVTSLVWFDRSGGRLGTFGSSGRYYNVRISPDGRRALFDRAREATGTLDIFSYDLERGTETPVTSEPNSEFAAVLLPDGRSIAYSVSRGRAPQLLRRDLATGKDEEMLPSGEFQLAQDVSPDGKSLVYTERGEGGVFNVWALALSGGGKPVPLVQSRFNNREVRFSPDGRFLAMISDESGRPEVSVVPYPGPGERVRVSTGGAEHLRWSRDGKEIFYISSDQHLVSVPVRTSPALALGTAVPLFSFGKGRMRSGALTDGLASGFDISPDGKRFLVVVPEVVADELPLTVVAHWTSEAPR